MKSNYESLSLDEEKCIVIYDGTKDKTTSGVKPIAIQDGSKNDSKGQHNSLIILMSAS